MRFVFLVLWFLSLSVISLPSFPHALDPESIDRHAEFTFTPSRIVLIYQIILGIMPTERETKRLDADHDGTISDAERDEYVKKASGEYLGKQTIRLNEQDLTFQFVQGDAYASFGHNGIQVIKIDIAYVCSLPADIPRNKKMPFFYEDHNITGISGWKQINTATQGGVIIEGHIPYREYKPFDYELLNEKGFMPSSDSIRIDVTMPALSESNETADVVFPAPMNPVPDLRRTVWEPIGLGFAGIVLLLAIVAIAIKLRR